MSDSERSFGRLDDADLRQLSRRVLDRLATVFRDAPVAGLYHDRLLLLALCQGSAEHYVGGRRGIKDLDVWAFFRARPDKPFPFRTVWNADFGPSHLGRSSSDVGYTGRRIDIIGRSIAVDELEVPEASVRAWLTGSTESARRLSGRPVIALYPEHLFKLRVV